MDNLRSKTDQATPDEPREFSGGLRAEDVAWLRMIERDSPVGMYRADADGRCTYVNARWCDLTGRTADSALGTGWVEAIHPDDVRRLFEEWQTRPGGRGPMHAEYRYLRPDGTSVWVLGQLVEQRNSQDEVTGYVGTATDITELRDNREELQRTQAVLEDRVRERTREIEYLALVVEGSVDAIISSDFEGRIVNWNKAAERMFGYSAVEMIGKTTFEMTPPDLLDESRDLKRRVRSGEPIMGHETLRRAKSGENIDVSISIFPVRDSTGQIIGTSAIVRDMTERKRAERQMHLLSGRLLLAQDEERRRIARELHDSTAQLLAALTMNLAVLKHRQDSPMDESKRRQLLIDSAQLAEEAARELRTHSYLLHPPMLDEGGLATALRCFIDGFSQRSGIAVDLEVDGNIGRLAAPMELTIFRVVQESLTNVMRHAQSATAHISLTITPPWLILTVRDAGRGLGADANECFGVGIAGMRERLLQLGGSLQLDSGKGGTTVVARVPFQS